MLIQEFKNSLNCTINNNSQITININCMLFYVCSANSGGSNTTATITKNGSSIGSNSNGSSWGTRVMTGIVPCSSGDVLKINWSSTSGEILFSVIGF